MGKFPEAAVRLFQNKFACKKCKTVNKANNLAIIAGKIKCRKCGGTSLRPLRKK